MKTQTNLKQAQADPKAMKKFIREHKGDQIESDDFDKVMGSMLGSGKSKAIQATSSKDADGDYT
jgi:hypothetical protein